MQAGLKYWVEPCVRPAEIGCKSNDPTSHSGAMEAWQGASDGKLRVQRTTDKSQAIIRIYWVGARAGLYGETRGGDVYVRPEPGEGLSREAIVYLTCLHGDWSRTWLGAYRKFRRYHVQLPVWRRYC